MAYGDGEGSNIGDVMVRGEEQHKHLHGPQVVVKHRWCR